MIWRKETDARLTEALVSAHEENVNARALRNELRPFEHTPRNVRAVTGQDPITEENE